MIEKEKDTLPLLFNFRNAVPKQTEFSPPNMEEICRVDMTLNFFRSNAY